jgi:hypothetical protein
MKVNMGKMAVVMPFYNNKVEKMLEDSLAV